MVILVRRSRLDARLSARRGSARRRCVSWGDRNSNAACRPAPACTDWDPARARRSVSLAPSLSLRLSFPLANPLAPSLCLSSSCSYTFYYIFLPEPKIPSILVFPVRLCDPFPLPPPLSLSLPCRDECCRSTLSFSAPDHCCDQEHPCVSETESERAGAAAERAREAMCLDE